MRKFHKLLMLLIVILLAVIILNTTNNSTETISKKEEADSNSITVSFRYTVKNYNGKVAVFNFGDDSYPVEILDCPINSLPESEKEKLNKGINIFSEQELQEIIEAYD